MKLKHMLIYPAFIIGGLIISVQGLVDLINSTSLVTLLHGLAGIAWGLSAIGYGGCYWLFVRHYNATTAKQVPSFDLSNASPWLNPRQQRWLTGIQYSFAGLALVWLLTKWFF